MPLSTTEPIVQPADETPDCESRDVPRRRAPKRGLEAPPDECRSNKARTSSMEQRHAGAESDDDSSSTASVADAAEASASTSSLSPSASAADDASRKIWMRSCNECGFELHVRRVRCTACGTLQTSKRAAAAAHEEKLKESRAPDEPAAASSNAPVIAEAEEAASQLAAIAEASGDGEAAGAADVADAAHAAAGAELADAAPSSLASALARLTPEQMVKLRRMQKLRALLSKLPAGVTLPPRPVAAADAAPAPADAISMLASVACM